MSMVGPQIEEFNEEKQRAKVAAGFKGGPFNSKPMLHGPMNFVDGVPAEVSQKMFSSGMSTGSTGTPWNASRQAK